MKVDVILPVYKSKPWITEAVESVISQTYTEWHLTIIDDACPEGSSLLVQESVNSFPNRISLIKLDTNHGAAAARMKAIQQTKGQVIAFIDQDDRWLPHKLEMQIKRFQAKPDVQAVHTNITHIDETGARIKGGADKENKLRASILFDQLSQIELSKLIFLKMPIRLSSSVFLRYAFEGAGGYNEKIPFGGEDFELWVKFASKFKIGHIQEALVERRIHSMNVSRQFSYSRALGELKTFEQLLHDHPFLLPLSKKRRSSLYRSLVRIGIQNKRPDISRCHARSLVRLNPLHMGSYLRLGMSYSLTLNKIVMRLYRIMKKARQLN